MKTGEKGFVLINKATNYYYVPCVITRINSKTVSVILLDDIPNSVYERGDAPTIDICDWFQRKGRTLRTTSHEDFSM
jgi:hypothetical protein